MNSKAKTHPFPISSIFLLVIASCSQDRIQPEASFSFSPAVQYSILRDETDDIVRSVDVQLNISVEESILDSIAQEIVNREEVQYEQTFILYYLPDMEVGNGAWAFSDTSSGGTMSFFNIGPHLEADIRAQRSGSLPEQNTGPTEAELVETLAFLQEKLVVLKLRLGDHDPMVASQQEKISHFEELLNQRRKEQ